MLFMITQVHTAETCPRDEGGSDVLIDRAAQGLTVKGRWGAWSRHTIWYLVEADNFEAIHGFLRPGLTRCTCTVEPVAEAPI
jgi:hypothetical protein